jgi:hypothetical protein
MTTPTYLTLAITLADGEDMPYIVARCSTRGWNGYHAPRLSPDTLRDYFAASAAADPNGEWGRYIVTADDTAMTFHNCEQGGCHDGEHDHAEDDVVTLDEDGTMFLDGWCWVSPRSADGATVAADGDVDRNGRVSR